MKVSTYLCIKKPPRYTNRASMRVVKTAPNLESDEIAIKLNIEIPDEIFNKPRLEASVTVPKDAISAPVIEAEVIDNVQEIIKQNTGFDVKLTVVSANEDE